MAPNRHVRSVPPLHEAGSPFFTRDPRPADVGIGNPAPVMVSHRAPAGLFLVFDPVPPPVLGKDPTTYRIGVPIAASVRRDPNLAPAGMLLPTAVRFQSGPELSRNRALPLRLPGPTLLRVRGEAGSRCICGEAGGFCTLGEAGSRCACAGADMPPMIGAAMKKVATSAAPSTRAQTRVLDIRKSWRSILDFPPVFGILQNGNERTVGLVPAGASQMANQDT